jgi:alpha-ribazole phosphatase
MPPAPDTAKPKAAPLETSAAAICDIWLIRHARGLDGGAMAGRRDIDADCSDSAALAALRARVGGIGAQDRLITSPAKRCLQTAHALWGRAPDALDPRLWEQNFGTWEGMAHRDLPDIGPLAQSALADFVPPQGESFTDICTRIWPALTGLGAGRHIVVAHAGTIRAALGLALGNGQIAAAHLGLGFSAANLSLTRISRCITPEAPTPWAIICANWAAA